MSLPDAHTLGPSSVPFPSYFPKIRPMVNLKEIQRITTYLNIVRDYRLGKCSTSLILKIYQVVARSEDIWSKWYG